MNMQSKCGNMHKNGMNFALKYNNNHVISCIYCMLLAPNPLPLGPMVYDHVGGLPCQPNTTNFEKFLENPIKKLFLKVRAHFFQNESSNLGIHCG